MEDIKVNVEISAALSTWSRYREGIYPLITRKRGTSPPTLKHDTSLLLIDSALTSVTSLST